jgi:Phosphotransferase enzyme family
MTDVELPRRELASVFGSVPASPRVEQLYAPVASASRGIWRVGVGDDTAVLKLIGHSDSGHPNWLSGEDEPHWYFWRREVCAYESGLFGSFEGGLRAPECLLVAPRADGTVALWLEDVQSAPGAAWSLDRYELAARDLGRMQGAFMTSQPLPTDGWLTNGWLRSYVARRETEFRRVDDPVVEALRAQQPVLLDALDRMPRTVCHLDLHPANMFGDDDGPTTAIDWSFVGVGAIGEDAGNLVPDSVLDFHVPGDQLDALYSNVLRGYLAGLRDARAALDEATVRLALSAAMVAKFVWIPAAMIRAEREGTELLNRRPRRQTIAAWTPVVDFLVERAAEARTLLTP